MIMFDKIIFIFLSKNLKDITMKILNFILVLSEILLSFTVYNAYGQTPEECFKNGYTKYTEGNYSGAITDFTKALELKPDIADAYFLRAVSKNETKDFEGAVSDFSKSIELNLIKQAKKEFELELIMNANDYFEEGVDYDLSEEKDSLYNKLKGLNNLILAIQYTKRGCAKTDLYDFEGAYSDFNKAIEYDSTYAYSYLERGFVKFKKMKFEEAIKDYDKFLELDSDNQEGYKGRGYCKSELLDYEGAISDFDKSIELDSTDYETFIGRASTKMGVLDFQGALDDYTKTIELNKEDYIAYYGRACVKLLLGDTSGACTDLNLSKEHGGKDIEIIENEIQNNCIKNKDNLKNNF